MSRQVAKSCSASRTYREWIESVERNDSGQIWLEFDELGIADWAILQGMEPCPSDILGEGRLVTGTFEHSSGEVLNLFIAGEATPIGSTANHPFWSEDRQDFVQAGSLNPGEHLRLADGRTTTLERTEPIAEQLPVYNLEVDGEHVYFVGESGVLVHNAGDKYPYRPPRRADMDNGVHGPNSPISDAIDRAIRENTRQGKSLSAKAAQKASRAADPTKRVQHVPIDPGDGIEIIPLPNGGGVLIRDATQAFVKQAGNVNHLFPVGPEHVIK